MEYFNFKKVHLKTINQNKFYNYSSEEAETGLSMVKVNGRFPKSNVAKNDECKLVVYVIGGSATGWVEEREFKMKLHDAVVIEKGEHFKFEGNVVLMIFSTPAWNEKQFQVCEYKSRYELSLKNLEENHEHTSQENCETCKVYTHDIIE